MGFIEAAVCRNMLEWPLHGRLRLIMLFRTTRITGALLTLVCLFAAATGCKSSPPPGDTSVVPSTPVSGTFKMYPTPITGTPDPFCDYFAELTIRETPTGVTAQLENKLEGMCEMAVFPQERSYRLVRREDDCGSRVYDGDPIGESPKDGFNFTHVRITDHRTRMCRDVVPAPIVVEEIDRNGDVIMRYSFQPERWRAIGELTSSVAIGGESTGYSLLTDDGEWIELLLSDELTREFKEGRRVEVFGHRKAILGVEIPVREVLVVEWWRRL